MGSQNDGPTRSYTDAYSKLFSPSSRRSPAKGYAEINARRSASPAPYYSSTPTKTISVLNRPKGITPSKKNTENLDTQFERDRGAFEKRANIYRRLASEPYHHHRAASSILTLWEAGHIVDKGRGRQSDVEVSNPIHHMVPNPKAGSSEAADASKSRPKSAPHNRPLAKASTTQQQMGDYNPILHTYNVPRDPAYESKREKEFHRANGLGNNGIAIRADPVRASFNPILGESRPASPAPRPVSAALTQAASEPSTPAERSATPGNRQHVISGESWGTYNPILNSWATPPRNMKFQDPSQVLNQKSGLNGMQKRKPNELPPNQGVYNPILNTWVVAPTNTKIMNGLSFAPALMFSQSNVTTVKS